MEKVKIENLDNFGKGIAYVEGKITFVKGMLKDEEGLINITKKKKNIMEADTVNIDKTSSDRVTPKCPYYGICGGCNTSHMTYESERVFKTNKVNQTMNRFSGMEINISDIVSANNFNYRNKVTFRVSNNKLSLYKEGSKDLVNIDECLLLDDEVNKAIKPINNYLQENPNFNEIMIRSNGLELSIDVKGKFTTTEFLRHLKNNNIVNITSNGKGRHDGDFIIDVLGKKNLVSNKSFFQVNSEITSEMYTYIKDIVSTLKPKNALDLYCGVGAITLTIAEYCKKITGIEISREAVKDAMNNKVINNVENIRYILGPVEDNIDSEEFYDLIVVDPPRAGLDTETLEAIKKIKPKDIIYVSCDPMTLARDIKILSDNYSIEDIKLFDMFPNTYHVETVVHLKKN